MGDLPASDQWHLISIDSAQLNLPAGTIVSDMLLSQFGGISWIDALSIHGQRSDKDPRASLDAWWEYAKDKNIPVVPKEVAAALKAGKKDGLSEGTLFQLQNSVRQVDGPRCRHRIGRRARRPGSRSRCGHFDWSKAFRAR